MSRQTAMPPKLSWVWEAELDFDGVSHRASWVSSPSDEWTRIALVEGLPERNVDVLLDAAQENSSKPAWYVDSASEESREARLERARERYRFDLEVYKARFVCGFAESSDGRLDPIGCGAVRNRITREYESSSWLVLGRILLLPHLRSRGIASYLTLQFLAASQAIYGTPGLGFVSESRAESIRRLLERAKKLGFLDVIKIDRRRWPQEEDKTYIGFYPSSRPWLLGASQKVLNDASLPLGVRQLVEGTRDIWQSGADERRCINLGVALREHEDDLAAASVEIPVLAAHLDFLRTLQAWGVLREPDSDHSGGGDTT